MYCEPFYFSGIGECKKLRDSICAFIPTTKGTTMTLANAGTLAGVKTALFTKDAVKGLVIDIKRGYEITSDDAEMTASTLGYTEKTDENPPKMTAHGFINYADYQLWDDAEGTEFDIILLLESGRRLGTKTSAGLFKGFRGRIFTKSGLPGIGADLLTGCPFYIIFDDIKEWKNGKLVEVGQSSETPIDFIDLNPIGVDISIKTAYEGAGKTVVIQAYKRNTTIPVAVFDQTTNWVVKSALNNIGGTVSVVGASNKALGQYTLTVVDGSAAAMSDDFVLQALDDDATYQTYLSNPLTIPV